MRDFRSITTSVFYVILKKISHCQSLETLIGIAYMFGYYLFNLLPILSIGKCARFAWWSGTIAGTCARLCKYQYKLRSFLRNNIEHKIFVKLSQVDIYREIFRNAK